MAVRRKDSVLGDMSGRVGTIVLLAWKGLNLMKILPVSRKSKKASKIQLPQNVTFKLVMDFLLKVGDEVFNVGYQLSRKSKMTWLNAVTSYHLLNAIEGEHPDCGINLSKVKFSRPVKVTENGMNAAFEGGAGCFLAVNWELSSFPDKTTHLDDEAVIVLYNKDIDEFFTMYGLRRNLLGYTFPVFKSFAGHEVFSWIFFVSADKKRVSETEYLGMIKVIA